MVYLPTFPSKSQPNLGKSTSPMDPINPKVFCWNIRKKKTRSRLWRYLTISPPLSIWVCISNCQFSIVFFCENSGPLASESMPGNNFMAQAAMAAKGSEIIRLPVMVASEFDGKQKLPRWAFSKTSGTSSICSKIQYVHIPETKAKPKRKAMFHQIYLPCEQEVNSA